MTSKFAFRWLTEVLLPLMTIALAILAMRERDRRMRMVGFLVALMQLGPLSGLVVGRMTGNNHGTIVMWDLSYPVLFALGYGVLLRPGTERRLAWAYGGLGTAGMLVWALQVKRPFFLPDGFSLIGSWITLPLMVVAWRRALREHLILGRSFRPIVILSAYSVSIALGAVYTEVAMRGYEQGLNFETWPMLTVTFLASSLGELLVLGALWYQRES